MKKKIEKGYKKIYIIETIKVFRKYGDKIFMLVAIGTIRSNFDGFDNISNIFKRTKPMIFESIELDFSGCNFFEANMSAPLYTVIANLRDNLNDVSIINISNEINKILRKNKFMTVFKGSELMDINQTTLPFKIFKLNSGNQFNDYLNKYMNGRGIPKMTVALNMHFLRNLFEVFQNATIHSKSESGVFVCGQFFPKKHRLDFTISDAGVGIRENVRRYNRDEKISSIDAIKWSLQEGNTTKTGSLPGGLGLKFLKDFIKKNKGKLQIISRYGYYEFSAKDECFKKMKYDFPGTCINIEINTEDKCNYCLKSELKTNNIF